MVPVLGERAQSDLLKLEKVCSRIYRPRVSNTQGHAQCALLLFHQHDPFKHSSTFLLILLYPVGFCKIGPTHWMSHFKCYRKKKTFWRAVPHSYLSQIKHGAVPALITGHVCLLHDTGSLSSTGSAALCFSENNPTAVLAPCHIDLFPSLSS